MMNVDGAGGAKRRRERRLRVMLRHERQTVVLELVVALHHSRDERSNVTNKASRGQKTASSRPGILSELATRGKPAAPLGSGGSAPGLALSVLVSGEAVDSSSLPILLQFSLAAQKQEEEEKERECALRVAIAPSKLVL